MTNHITKVFNQCCNELHFAVQQIGPSEFRAYYAGKNAHLTVHFLLSMGRISCFSRLPFAVPADRRLAVLTYLNLFNWHIAVGNLEMDPDGGEIHFRSGIACLDQSLTADMIGLMLTLNLITCDRCLPGLAQIIFANMDPFEAYRLSGAPFSSPVADNEEDQEEDDVSNLDSLLDDIDFSSLSNASDD